MNSGSHRAYESREEDRLRAGDYGVHVYQFAPLPIRIIAEKRRWEAYRQQKSPGVAWRRGTAIWGRG